MITALLVQEMVIWFVATDAFGHSISNVLIHP
jgi:hypothetical protein